MDIILDTETTGLKPGIDELLQVSIIDTDGHTLMDVYLRPTRCTEWPEAMEINGITPEMVAGCPTIDDVRNVLQFILHHADHIIGYNTMFDIGFLAAAGFDVPNQDELIDVMAEFAEMYGDLRDDGSYKWQRLTTAAAYYGYQWPINAHNALGDCLATLYVYQCMHKNIVTNGDKIRSMTDDELADFLDTICRSAYDTDCDKCPMQISDTDPQCNIRLWLKKEVIEDETD